jgi:hypothetical protein
VTLPIASPAGFDPAAVRSYGSPRLWLDLLQRATGKLRWKPMGYATIVLTRFDSCYLHDDDCCIGGKALVDSLKVSTTGRSDRQLLYYFGAIQDDAPHWVKVDYHQQLVAGPALAKSHIRIEALRESRTLQARD